MTGGVHAYVYLHMQSRYKSKFDSISINKRVLYSPAGQSWAFIGKLKPFTTQKFIGWNIVAF